ncbi:unnamed protein product [Clonostachys rhizophaga]|uniref:DNA-directed DNA polymerase n=1 Tax=Clonostachys rhizophaga TaxID=160324 RepID=A0A9N9VJ56_9HYPO|nr:unnamed protein product [Clonostachys rhizophaga]
MVSLNEVSGSLLHKPTDSAHSVGTRTDSQYKPLTTFNLSHQRSYQQQYGDMYFLRLTKIKPAVEEVAAAAWERTVIGDETAKQVERALDVRQGELCWVVGTVYMNLQNKPNILEDVSKDRWISKPDPVHKYFKEDETEEIMLEDDSGRVRLVGDILHKIGLATGCIMAVMGTENSNGEFEVIDVKFPDLPPQPERWALSGQPVTQGNGVKKVKDEDQEMSGQTGGKRKKVAIVSGLAFSGSDASYALELELLLEFLLGEVLSPDAQSELSEISRLIVAGNSISESDVKPVTEEENKNKKYGYDASAYNAVPSQLFDEFLAEILASIPVTLMPGPQDPANSSYPQQPTHPAMFPNAREYTNPPGSKEPGWLDIVTNPWEGEIDGWRVLGTGGQNVDDVYKYVNSEDRLGMMEAMCRWRCCAPTAPDTLWSYPFQDDDPFVLKDCPHLYFVGCQPEFGTKVVSGPTGQSVRLITVPSFAATKEIVLVDTETLEVTKVKIMTA